MLRNSLDIEWTRKYLKLGRSGRIQMCALAKSLVQSGAVGLLVFATFFNENIRLHVIY